MSSSKGEEGIHSSTSGFYFFPSERTERGPRGRTSRSMGRNRILARREGSGSLGPTAGPRGSRAARRYIQTRLRLVMVFTMRVRHRDRSSIDSVGVSFVPFSSQVWVGSVIIITLGQNLRLGSEMKGTKGLEEKFLRASITIAPLVSCDRKDLGK